MTNAADMPGPESLTEVADVWSARRVLENIAVRNWRTIEVLGQLLSNSPRASQLPRDPEEESHRITRPCDDSLLLGRWAALG